MAAPGSFPNSPPPPPPSLLPMATSVMPSPPVAEPAPVTAAADKLESQELVKLLEIIDKLREFGVSEDISLPQVCVSPLRQTVSSIHKFCSHLGS